MGAPTPLAQTLIPDNMDNSLSYSVLNYLKRLKNQAKIEFERLCNEVISKQVANANLNKNLVNGNSTTVTEGVRVIPRTPLKKDLVRGEPRMSHPTETESKTIGSTFRYRIRCYRINSRDLETSSTSLAVLLSVLLEINSSNEVLRVTETRSMYRGNLYSIKS